MCRAKPSKPANIACNNGKSRRPRLKNDDAERLVAACKGKCVGVGIFGNQLWAPWLQRTDKRNAVRDAKLGGATLKLLVVVRLGHRSDEAKRHVGMPRDGLDKRHLVFLAVDTRNAKESERVGE